MSTMNTNERMADLEAQSRGHTSRLIGLEESFRVLHDEVRGVSAELKSLVAAVVKQEALPRFELAKMMTIIAGVIVIFGAVSSGIIYIASNVSAPATLENRLKLGFLKDRLDNGWYKPLPGFVTTTEREDDK